MGVHLPYFIYKVELLLLLQKKDKSHGSTHFYYGQIRQMKLFMVASKPDWIEKLG